MTKKLVATLGMAFVVLVAGMAFAGEATDVVKAKQTELFEVIAKPESKERTEALRTIFNEMLAYDKFAKASLGKKKWKELTADERTIFQDKLTKLVRCNYKRNLTKMLAYDITYLDEEKGEGSFEGTVLVPTRAQSKENDEEAPLEIDFRMKEIKGAWKVVDIYTERASLVKTWKVQFLRTIKEGGVEKLFKKMDDKIKKDGCI